jgi:endoglucanase
VSSQGNTGYGVGLGINFKPDAAPNARDLYNAQADGFTGVGFFAQCKQEITGVFLKFSDDATEAQVVTPQCSFDGKAPLTRLCRQYGVKNAVLLSNGWTHYEVYFSDALLDTDATEAGTSLHTNALTAFQIQINSKSATAANPFDCLIDDVHFLHDAAPATPPPANVTTVAGHAIAPGGYYTQGNQIFDSSGNVHVFKGLDRPSMEFDPAGQGITRDDIQRMKAVGANVIRYSLSEGYWLSTHPQFNANYQAYVDRAVYWTLQYGMDVILDLHWSGNPAAQQQMADKQAITFWQQVATKYKGDGRVLFELYNEPHDISGAVWKGGDGTFAGMQQLYDAVRGTGANNLVMAGGVDFANDLDSLLPAQALTGINVAYVTHPYIWKTPPSGYDASAAMFPVIATEFGNAAANPGGLAPDSCDASAYTSTIADFTKRGMSWTSWAWFVSAQRCAFPSLLDKFDGTPTPPGQAVFAALKQ